MKIDFFLQKPGFLEIGIGSTITVRSIDQFRCVLMGSKVEVAVGRGQLRIPI